ncbi:MAG: GAF domain-containing protein, partial [Blastocatellia bacterium]|nr:GAF domain-containing protein [Blastocatellia bacterium]
MRENDQSLLQVFNDLSHILLKSRSSDDALSSIAKLCRNVLNSQYCIISRVYTEGRFLVTVACSGSDDEFEKFILGKKFDKENKYIDFDLVFKGEKIEVYDIHKNGQGVANPDIANLFDLQSLLSYPLKVGEHLVGYINHFSSNNSQFTEYDKKVLEIFANQAVLAIDFLDRKFHEVAEARQEIMRLDDEEAVWDYVVKSAGKLTGAPWVCIGKLDYKTGSLQIVRTTKAIPKDCEFFTNRDSEKSVMVKSIKDGKTILINDLEGKEHLKWGGEP